VAQADYEYLLAFPIPGQTTISEKLRHVLAFFRTYHESLEGYAECRAEMERLLVPATKHREAHEHALGTHSEVARAVAQSVPALMALLITDRVPPGDPEALERLREGESRLLRESLRLLERLLRLAITPQAPAYRPEALRRELKTVLELVEFLKPSAQPNQADKGTPA
jgi:hypothetical protein